MRNNRFAAAVADDDDFPTCPGCNKQVWPSERSLKAMGVSKVRSFELLEVSLERINDFAS